MNRVTTINKDVNVIAYYFRGERPKSFPKRMEFEGKEVIFETGLRRLARRDQHYVRVFDMTDGSEKYRLEFDVKSLAWKLVYVAKNVQQVLGL